MSAAVEELLVLLTGLVAMIVSGAFTPHQLLESAFVQKA
jgi:uncharacterized membrane protein